MNKTVFIVGKDKEKINKKSLISFLDNLSNIITKLVNKKINVFIEKETYNTLEFYDLKLMSVLFTDNKNFQIGNYSRVYDCCIVFGGDGTVLETSKYFAGSNTSIIGVNFGRLGFISDIPKSIAEIVILKMINGEFVKEEKILLQTNNLNKLSLNDIVLQQNNGRILDFEVFIDDQFAYNCRGDGLIISTSTGSSAYSLAAGGSLISPEAKVLSIIPMLPQTLSYRPLIINDDSIIKIVLLKGSASLFFDGIKTNEIKQKEPIEIFKSNKSINFLHPNCEELKYNYFKTLREKLNWHLEPTK